jgi:hypothetical protein
MNIDKYLAYEKQQARYIFGGAVTNCNTIVFK